MRRALHRLPDEHFDLLIVGGGATGAFVARDAAMRGLSVALVERGDFAGATSAHNSKLVHGGLRYLRNGEFGLVRESLRERRNLQNIAPHLVRPLSFLLPLYGGGLRQRAILEIGLTLYDFLAFDRNQLDDPAQRLPRHRWLGKRAALEAEPALDARGFTGAFAYPDAQMYAPERIALECLIDADAHGAAIANHVGAETLLLRDGKVEGCHVVDAMTGNGFDIRAKTVLLAMGPWSDLFLERALGKPAVHRLVRSKGIHLLVPALTKAHALAVEAGSGHFFVMPWRGHSLIGTTDAAYAGDPDALGTSDSDIDGFVAVINKYLPALKLRRDQVEFFYAGLRPLVADGAADTYGVSRRAALIDHGAGEGLDGLFSALGGKWTSSRGLAETVTDALVAKLGKSAAPCATATTQLPGGRIDRFDGLVRGMQKTYPGVPLQHLAHMFGARLPLVLKGAKLTDLVPLHESGDTPAQIAFAMREEMALTLEDVVMRRTALGQFGRPSSELLAQVAAIMGAELGWAVEKQQSEMASLDPPLPDGRMTAFAVYNPRAGNGRTGRDWAKIEDALETVFPLLTAVPSRAPGQTTRLVRDALKDGHLDIVAVGGDGTINEALNGFFEHGAPVSPDAVLSIVTTGTDGNFCRTLNLEPGYEAAIQRLRQSRIRKLDVGHLSCVSADGAAVTRFFLNSASFGISGRIAWRLNRARIAKFFGAPFAYALHASLALIGWRECRVRLMADNGYDEIAGIAAVAVANGQYFGGGLQVAPHAVPNDGLFDLVIMGGAHKARIFGTRKQIHRGQHLSDTGVRLVRSTRLTAAPTLDTRGPVLVETDGEAAGMLPATFEILPAAIRIRS